MIATPNPIAKQSKPTRSAYEHAAWMIRCSVAAIMAVAEVESGRFGAWFPDGAPVILFEPHYFHELTGGKFDVRYPTLSYPKWGAKPYGANSEQHVKLEAAAKLDREAAMKSASWGLFQLMGANYRRAGHASVQSFVNAMYRDVDEHLRAFVMFILSDEVMADALRNHEWAKFAARYNGSGYATHGYHTRMKEAYERIAK